MKYFINNYYKKDIREKGSVVIIMLVIFFAVTLFFFGLYHLVFSDYIRSSKGVEYQSEYNNQFNLVESLAVNYKKDMLNDIEYDDMKLNYSTELEDGLYDFKIEYNNYKYDFIKVNEEKEYVEDKGKFGRFDWVKFKNYTDIEVGGDDFDIIGNKNDYNDVVSNEDRYIIREYKISENWKVNGNEKVDYYKNNSLQLRVPLYVKVEFGEGVSSLDLELGNTQDKKKFNFINRDKEEEIFRLDDIPYGISVINLTSEHDLGGTSVSILKGREIDVVVCSNDGKLDSKCLEKVDGDSGEKDDYKINYFNKVLVKTINIELGKMNNYIYFD